MNWNVLEPQIENLKNGIISVMDKIEEATASNPKLPEVSSAMTAARNLIEYPSYDVVVCGEVKKGKSSLLNAIIGQEILPVNNEIATSQVFRITNASAESFFLVFTDGTRKQISREELSRYGSQVDANLEGEPLFQDHTLSYIQVNVPVAFLPEGVSLVDTPGLGALYKSHEWITQNYVSKASAVIFVMDPERPLVEKEKEFMLKVLDITPHILYVMTKIDMYAADVCNNIMERNRELLGLIYSEKQLEAPQIYPVSSTALMKVSTGKVQAIKASNLINSRFPQLKEQLMYIIYKAVGLQQTGLAIREAADHTVKCKSIIDDLIKATTAENAQEIQRLYAEKEEKQNDINAKWGNQSENRAKIQNEINAVINSVRSFVQQMTSTSGELYQHYVKQIEAADSKTECDRIQASMPRTIADEMEQEWATICSRAKQNVNELLAQMQASLSMESQSLTGIEVTEETSKLTMMDYIPEIRSAIGIGFLVSAALSALLGPVALVLSWVITVIMGKEFVLKKNRNKLKENLNKGFNQVAIELMHVKPGETRSKVDSFTFALKQASDRAIKDMIDKQKEQLQQELSNIQQQTNLSIETKKAEAKRWDSVKNEWDKIVEEIKQLVAKRNEIALSLGIKK